MAFEKSLNNDRVTLGLIVLKNFLTSKRVDLRANSILKSELRVPSKLTFNSKPLKTFTIFG